jgi:hypothetical protein
METVASGSGAGLLPDTQGMFDEKESQKRFREVSTPAVMTRGQRLWP